MAQDDMLDRALAFGASMDWFTPLLSMTGGALGWWRHFAIPKELFPDVHALLRAKRIAMRNWQHIDGVCTFDIDAGSAPLVADWLSRYWGIEFTRPPRWLAHRRRRPRRARARRRRTR